MSMDGILVNLLDSYSGTRLLAVLNIEDCSCLARLSARLSRRRARTTWADLISQPDPVIMLAALFCSFPLECFIDLDT